MKKMRPAVLSRIGRPLTYTRAVPVAAYMGAPFNAVGQLMTPGGFLKAMEQYLYGAWDGESRKQAYAYDHEPLMVTLEYLEQEVEALNKCVLLPTSTQEVDESHFCAPLESISVLVIVNKKILEVRVARERRCPCSKSSRGGDHSDRRCVQGTVPAAVVRVRPLPFRMASAIHSAIQPGVRFVH